MKRVIKMLDRISAWGGILSGVMICLGLALVLAEIFLRSAFDSTIYVAEEYAGYLMCGLTFFALAYTLREKAHIRMTFLHKFVQDRKRSILDLVCYLVGFLFSLGLTWNTFWFFWDSVVSRSQSMQISEAYLAIPQVAMPLGALLLALQFVSDFCREVLILKGDVEGVVLVEAAQDLGR